MSHLLESTASNFILVDGFKVHFKVCGKGSETVALIHGWCSDASLWREQVKALGSKLQLLLIDLPGYGKSERPFTDYTMKHFARAVISVLQVCGAKKPILVGHSMGTAVARQCYRKIPSFIKALVFIDGELRPFSSDPAEVEKYLAGFTSENLRERLQELSGALFSSTASTKVREDVLRSLYDVSPHVALSSLRNHYQGPNWDEDPIKIPLLAIMSNSSYWTDDYRAFMNRVALNLRYETVQNPGHFIHLELPDVVNRLILQFIRDLSG